MPEWIYIVLKALALLIALFFMTRWLGKKQLTQLNVFEYISGIVLGGIVAINTIDQKANIVYGLLAMFVWFIVPFGVEYFSLKSKRFRDFVQGKSTVLIKDGKIMEDNLKKEKFTTDDLLESLRNKDIFKAADVEFAILEPSGTVNVLPKKENKTLTLKDIGIEPASEKEPQTVIMDGKMLLEPLADLALNPNWLETELDKLNVSIENVFLAQADSDGQLTVDLYDDQLSVAKPTEKPLLLATMKKCQADLELFALATENKASQKMYEQNSQKLQQAIEQVHHYLK
ncbi:MAG TPA: DUF421 domain-containing protein [Bacillota bacterium]|nr:DUF421 domain-containing protein [Bacillota bacterium]